MVHMGKTKQATTHRISWWVYAGREKIRRTANMRGTWGCDVTCSCGWETRTGGATTSYIRREVWLHKLLTEQD